MTKQQIMKEAEEWLRMFNRAFDSISVVNLASRYT